MLTQQQLVACRAENGVVHSCEVALEPFQHTEDARQDDIGLVGIYLRTSNIMSTNSTNTCPRDMDGRRMDTA